MMVCWWVDGKAEHSALLLALSLAAKLEQNLVASMDDLKGTRRADPSEDLLDMYTTLTSERYLLLSEQGGLLSHYTKSSGIFPPLDLVLLAQLEALRILDPLSHSTLSE